MSRTNGPQEQVRQDDEPGGNPAGGELSGAGEGSDHRRAPKRRGGVQAGDVDALTQDHARSEKADARNDPEQPSASDCCHPGPSSKR
jgi:hypothetical protein